MYRPISTIYYTYIHSMMNIHHLEFWPAAAISTNTIPLSITLFYFISSWSRLTMFSECWQIYIVLKKWRMKSNKNCDARVYTAKLKNVCRNYTIFFFFSFSIRNFWGSRIDRIEKLLSQSFKSLLYESADLLYLFRLCIWRDRVVFLHASWPTRCLLSPPRFLRVF